MSENLFLLLIPYGILLSWSLRNHKLNSPFGISASVFTSLSIWLWIYLFFNPHIYTPASESAFKTVEELMRSPYGWKLSYLAQHFGYLLGLSFFSVCWFFSRYCFTRQSSE